MKLVIAIINQQDVEQVAHALTCGGFDSTRFASRGSYLLEDNTTFLVGVDENRVNEVKRIVENSVHRQSRTLPHMKQGHYGYTPDESDSVTVGGATIFVVDIEQFERI